MIIQQTKAYKMVGSKDYVHAQMGRRGNEQPRIFRQIIRKTSRILDNFYFFQPWQGDTSHPLSLYLSPLSCMVMATASGTKWLTSSLTISIRPETAEVAIAKTSYRQWHILASYVPHSTLHIEQIFPIFPFEPILSNLKQWSNCSLLQLATASGIQWLASCQLVDSYAPASIILIEQTSIQF